MPAFSTTMSSIPTVATASVEGTGHRRGIGDVAHHHPRAGLLRLGPGVPREGDDLRPRVDEPTYHREPDPGGSPGDQGRPSREGTRGCGEPFIHVRTLAHAGTPRHDPGQAPSVSQHRRSGGLHVESLPDSRY